MKIFQPKTILAIETSCDETSIAIAKFSGSRRRPCMRVHAHLVLSQIPVHRKFGGVVPNLAKREHEKNLAPMLAAALKRAHFSSKVPRIDVIAVTYGPGLAPALWAGVNFALALGVLWGKPLIPVNHMEGHIYSAFIKQNRELGTWKLEVGKFPALALLVSGGHTEIVLMRGHGKYKILGETRDDAAGEAFDKVARILGLGYPGGPEISRLAKKGNSAKYPFPSPMLHSKDYDFSFSGLKTAVLYFCRAAFGGKVPQAAEADIAASFQKAVVDVLIAKTIRAAREYMVKTIIFGGGVAANEELRERLALEIKEYIPTTKYYIPDTDLAGDNALMIATAAYFMGKKRAPIKVGADAHARLA